MGELAPIALPIRSNKTKFSVEGSGRIINGYVEELGMDGVTKFAVYCRPGLSDFGTLTGGGGIRALLVIGGKMYVVAGRVCFVVDTSGTATKLGGVPTDGPVYMQRNRREPAEIAIVSAGLYFVIDTNTDTLSQINDPDLNPAQSLAVVDGYAILPGPGDEWQISQPDDFTDIRPLNFASAEFQPDKIVRVVEYYGEAWFLGATSTEAWKNTGAADFPFTRTTPFPVGCLAAGAVAIVDDKLIWIADDRKPKIANGYGAQNIGNSGVIRDIEAEPNPADMTAFTFAFQGHNFYVLNGTNFTWVYDVTTGSWVEWKTYGYDRWNISQVARFDGNLIAGDSTTGKLYTLSADNLDDAGTTLLWQLYFPPVLAFPNGLIFDALYLQMVTGVGLNTTDAHNLDPKVMIDWSDDGGATFGEQRVHDLGRLGKTQTTVEEFALGSIDRANARTFRVGVSAAVRKGLVGAVANVEATAA